MGRKKWSCNERRDGETGREKDKKNPLWKKSKRSPDGLDMSDEDLYVVKILKPPC